MMQSSASRQETWPQLALEAWSDTYATLHMWTQIVGKIRLAQICDVEGPHYFVDSL